MPDNDTSSNSLPSSSLSNPSDALTETSLSRLAQNQQYRRNLDKAAREAWLKASRIPLRIGRASQLDADLLDQQLTTILKGELFQALGLISRKIEDQYEPEITALLQFAMYRLSIYAVGATYGGWMQNLHYQNNLSKNPTLEKWQKIAYILSHVGGRWAWLRLSRIASTQDWSEQQDWRNQAWMWMGKMEKVWKAASLLNFMVFLYDGKFKSLIDRLLGMRLVYTKRDVQHQISYEFMNRQLVWTAFTEFLLFLLPLINLGRIKSTLGRLFSRGNAIDLPPQICAICFQNEQAGNTTNMESLGMGTTSSGPFVSGTGNRAVNPHITECGHVYCYYCIKTAMMQDGNFACPRCLKIVTKIQRWTGNTLEAVENVDKIE